MIAHPRLSGNTIHVTQEEFAKLAATLDKRGPDAEPDWVAVSRLLNIPQLFGEWSIKVVDVVYLNPEVDGFDSSGFERLIDGLLLDDRVKLAAWLCKTLGVYAVSGVKVNDEV